VRQLLPAHHCVTILQEHNIRKDGKSRYEPARASLFILILACNHLRGVASRCASVHHGVTVLQAHKTGENVSMRQLKLGVLPADVTRAQNMRQGNILTVGWTDTLVVDAARVRSTLQ
jgi:hypothetical protein